jgi:hypothetical protein
MTLSTTKGRLHRLLEHLSPIDFRAPPTSVGLKTMTRARIQGLIELGKDLREPVARITKAGERWLDEQSVPPSVSLAGDAGSAQHPDKQINVSFSQALQDQPPGR